MQAVKNSVMILLCSDNHYFTGIIIFFISARESISFMNALSVFICFYLFLFVSIYFYLFLFSTLSTFFRFYFLSFLIWWRYTDKFMTFSDRFWKSDNLPLVLPLLSYLPAHTADLPVPHSGHCGSLLHEHL